MIHRTFFCISFLNFLSAAICAFYKHYYMSIIIVFYVLLNLYTGFIIKKFMKKINYQN